MTDEQRKAAERLQEQQNKASGSDRRKFIHAITSVPKQELETAPQPPKEKRGRKPKSDSK